MQSHEQIAREIVGASNTMAPERRQIIDALLAAEARGFERCREMAAEAFHSRRYHSGPENSDAVETVGALKNPYAPPSEEVE